MTGSARRGLDSVEIILELGLQGDNQDMNCLWGYSVGRKDEATFP